MVEVEGPSLERRDSWISPTKASSVACYIVLTHTILGSGILGLPFAVARTGWLVGLLLLFACGAASCLGLHFLTCCAMSQDDPTSATFYSVGRNVMPLFTSVIDFAIFLNGFGVATSYLIVVGDMMPSVMWHFGASAWWLQRDLWILIGFSIVCPLCYLRNLDSLKFTSFFSLLFVCFLTFMVLLYSFGFDLLNPCGDDGSSTSCRGDIEGVVMDISTVKVLCIFVYGYTCAQNVFGIIHEIENPTLERVNMVTTMAIVTVLGLYILLAFSGYGTFGSNVASDILVSYPDNMLTSIARLFVSLLVAFSYPIQCHPSRTCIISLYHQLLRGIKDTFLLGGIGNNPDKQAVMKTNYSQYGAVGDSSVSNRDSSGQSANRVNRVTATVYNASTSNRSNRTSSNSNGSDNKGPYYHSIPTTEGTSQIEEGNMGMRQQPQNNIDETGTLAAAMSVQELIMHIIVTTIFLLCSLSIALSMTSLGVMLALVGATGSTTVSYILPGFFYYFTFKNVGESPRWKLYAALALGIAGLLIVPVCLTAIFL